MTIDCCLDSSRFWMADRTVPTVGVRRRRHPGNGVACVGRLSGPHLLPVNGWDGRCHPVPTGKPHSIIGINLSEAPHG